MVQRTTPITDLSSPSVDKKSVFSFYIQEPSDINPFSPCYVSTLRKTHHVSMPTLPTRPQPVALRNRLSLDNLHKPTQRLQKHPSLRPFLIKVQSRAGQYENTDTVSKTAFTRPTRGRRSSDKVIQAKGQDRKQRGGETKKSGESRLKGCLATIKRNLMCGSTCLREDMIGKKRCAYYFI